MQDDNRETTQSLSWRYVNDLSLMYSVALLDQRHYETLPCGTRTLWLVLVCDCDPFLQHVQTAWPWVTFWSMQRWVTGRNTSVSPQIGRYLIMLFGVMEAYLHRKSLSLLVLFLYLQDLYLLSALVQPRLAVHPLMVPPSDWNQLILHCFNNLFSSFSCGHSAVSSIHGHFLLEMLSFSSYSSSFGLPLLTREKCTGTILFWTVSFRNHRYLLLGDALEKNTVVISFPFRLWFYHVCSPTPHNTVQRV